MSGRIIKDTTVRAHHCEPPTEPEGYNSWGPVGSKVTYGVDTVWQCDCGRRWIVAEVERPKTWCSRPYFERAWVAA